MDYYSPMKAQIGSLEMIKTFTKQRNGEFSNLIWIEQNRFISSSTAIALPQTAVPCAGLVWTCAEHLFADPLSPTKHSHLTGGGYLYNEPSTNLVHMLH